MDEQRRRPEKKLRRMQQIRTKPQRSIEPRPAREMQKLNRRFTGRS